MWDAAGTTELASVTVVAGDALADGNYRYHRLASNFTLLAGTTYRIAGETTNEDFWDEDIGGTTLREPFSGINGVTITDDVFGTVGGTLTSPGNGSPGRWAVGNATFIPNPAPEPSSIMLATLGLFGLGFVRRRRNNRR